MLCYNEFFWCLLVKDSVYCVIFLSNVIEVLKIIKNM